MPRHSEYTWYFVINGKNEILFKSKDRKKLLEEYPLMKSFDDSISVSYTHLRAQIVTKEVYDLE